MERKGLGKRNHKLTDYDLKRNYEDLANAIILQACVDYQSEKGDTVKSKVRKDSIVNFFYSDFFSLLTNIDPDYLIERLENGNKVQFPDDVTKVGGALA